MQSIFRRSKRQSTGQQSTVPNSSKIGKGSMNQSAIVRNGKYSARKVVERVTNNGKEIVHTYNNFTK